MAFNLNLFLKFFIIITYSIITFLIFLYMYNNLRTIELDYNYFSKKKTNIELYNRDSIIGNSILMW